jgi:hypothetical protein
MKRVITGLSIAGMTLIACQAASADSGYGRYAGPVRWHVEGGYSEPSGQISDYLQGGYVVSGGFTYAPDRGPLALRADISLSAHNATNSFIDYGTMVSGLQVDSGTGRFFSFSLGPSYSLPFVGRSHLYGFAQAGIYRSSLQLTQTAFFSGTYCDPFFAFCQGAVNAGDAIVYEDRQTRFGWNAGLGLDFGGRFGPTYFIEASYHRLEGSQPIEYVPIEFGVRF